MFFTAPFGGLAKLRKATVNFITSFRLYVCLSVRLSDYLSVRLFICTSVYLSVCLSICPSVYLFACLSVRLSIFSLVYLSVCLSVRLPICSPVCLPVCPFAWNKLTPIGRICMMLYFNIFLTLSKILVSLKSDKNDKYFTFIPVYTFVILSD